MDLEQLQERSQTALAAAEMRFAEGCTPVEYVQYCVIREVLTDLTTLVIPIDWGNPH